MKATKFNQIPARLQLIVVRDILGYEHKHAHTQIGLDLEDDAAPVEEKRRMTVRPSVVLRHRAVDNSRRDHHRARRTTTMRMV
jgi:hypothetical protein